MPGRVLFIQRRLPKYRGPFFEELRGRLTAEGIHLDVACGRPDRDEKMRGDEGELPWATVVSGFGLRLGGVRLVWQRLGPLLRRGYDLVVMPGENSMLYNYRLLAGRRLRGGGPRLAFFGHGANFQAAGGNSRRERIKDHFALQADWWFAYTALSVRKLAAKGFPEERITCVDNAVDTSALAAFRKEVTVVEAEELRGRLKLKGRAVALFLGSLTPGKRLPFLFQAAGEVRRNLPEFELLIVGDGPSRDVVEAFAAKHDWVRWVGMKEGRELAVHAALAKVMVNPGMVGLGLVDGFALGLPLVTTDCGIHSPEIAYFQSWRNGLMSGSDVASFAEALNAVLVDEAVREKMRRACLDDARRYTVENMAANFSEGIVRALGEGRNMT